MKENGIAHLIFGYGSLICYESAVQTAPTLVRCRPFPCVVHGIERAWNKRSKMGMTAMGVQWTETGSCAGVLYSVREEELALLDEREVGYQRHAIDSRRVQLLDYLEQKEHYYGHGDLLQSLLNNYGRGTTKIVVWVYIPEIPMPPDENHPIAQSYIDVILQGCLDIHERFAQDFLQDTKGWSPREIDISKNIDENNHLPEASVDSNDAIAWVDDRDRPIYSRAHLSFSQQNRRALDALLQKHRPEVSSRKPLAPLEQEPVAVNKHEARTVRREKRRARPFSFSSILRIFVSSRF